MTAPIGNSRGGIWIQDSFDNTIGGIGPGAGNVIGGNTWDGIAITGAGSTGNRVQGNWIGTDVLGTTNLGNTDNGIWIVNNAADNLIGGPGPGAGNTIAFNTFNGIHVAGTAGNRNTILGNEIYNNTLLGIDLDADGAPTPNDANDGDNGPNELQNYPVLTTATTDGVGTVTVSGTLNSNPSTNYRIEFFSSPAGDPSGHGEARQLLGSIPASTRSGTAPSTCSWPRRSHRETQSPRRPRWTSAAETSAAPRSSPSISLPTPSPWPRTTAQR